MLPSSLQTQCVPCFAGCGRIAPFDDVSFHVRHDFAALVLREQFHLQPSQLNRKTSDRALAVPEHKRRESRTKPAPPTTPAATYAIIEATQPLTTSATDHVGSCEVIQQARLLQVAGRLRRAHDDVDDATTASLQPVRWQSAALIAPALIRLIEREVWHVGADSALQDFDIKQHACTVAPHQCSEVASSS